VRHIILKFRPVLVDQVGGTPSVHGRRGMMLMAEARRFAAAGAASRHRLRLGVFYVGARLRGNSAPMPAKPDDQFITGQPRLDPHRAARPKPQIDIVPGDGRVASQRGGGAGDPSRMRVALNDFAIRLKRRFVDRVRQLAEPAAGRRHKTALLQHATGDVAASPAGPPDLFPETEDGAGRHPHPIEQPRRRGANSAPCRAGRRAPRASHRPIAGYGIRRALPGTRRSGSWTSDPAPRPGWRIAVGFDRQRPLR
jgi:hypothetical protein